MAHSRNLPDSSYSGHRLLHWWCMNRVKMVACEWFGAELALNGASWEFLCRFLLWRFIIVLMWFCCLNSVLQSYLWFDLYIFIFYTYTCKCIHCIWLNIVLGLPISFERHWWEMLRIFNIFCYYKIRHQWSCWSCVRNRRKFMLHLWISDEGLAITWPWREWHWLCEVHSSHFCCCEVISVICLLFNLQCTVESTLI